jgi:hypothetical protein
MRRRTKGRIRRGRRKRRRRKCRVRRMRRRRKGGVRRGRRRRRWRKQFGRFSLGGERKGTPLGTLLSTCSIFSAFKKNHFLS